MSSVLSQHRSSLFGILLLGFILRTFQYNSIPPGLYVDEATVGYEAFSLLKTGADRWGFTLPVYFVNWGSGQSVLYSYFSIPFVSMFGLSRFSVRLLDVFIGILALPVMYVAVKRRFGKSAALIATMLLAILPWHVMLSRWAQDANLLPFFLLLGIYTVTRALEPKASHSWIVLALIPWGLSLYAYAMSFIVFPIMIALIVLFYWQTIIQNWKTWLVSAVIFSLFLIPIALFLIKNFLVHDTMPFESWLPFSLPLLITTRLQFVSSSTPVEWIENLFFLANGFQLGDSRSSLLGHPPIFLVFVPLCLLGVLHWIWEFRQTKRPDLFLVWLIASLPIVVLIDAGVTHYNSFFMPVLVAAVVGLLRLMQALNPSSRRVLTAGISFLIGLQAIVFSYDYFFVFPSLPEYESAFAKNFDRAIANGIAISKPSDPILLPTSLEFNYIFVNFYTSYPPEKFQHEVRYTLQYSEYFVLSFGRFFIGVDNLPDPRPFTYVLGKWDADPCLNPRRVWETRLWKVGRCE